MASVVPLRVLIVDDDVDTAQTLAYLVMDLGHHAIYALNGQATMEFARRFQPDVVIMDLVLPDADGRELVRDLRKAAGERPLALYAHTGYVDEYAKRFADAEFDGYFLKPLHPGVVEKILGRVEAGEAILKKSA